MNTVESTSNDKDENYWLERISLHPANASIMPLVLALCHKKVDSSIKTEILELIEKLNFRYYVSGIANRNDSSQGTLFQYAFTYYHFYGKDIIEEDNKSPVIVDNLWLKQKIIDFISRNANDYAFVKALTLDKDESGDYFSWHGLKFFLACYEEDIRSLNTNKKGLRYYLETDSDYYEKEHIWARKEFSKLNDSKSPHNNKRRLANFILLNSSLNKSVSNHPIEEKLIEYFNNDKIVPDTQMIRDLNNLFIKAKESKKEELHQKNETKAFFIKVYTKFFDMREQQLIEFALKRWNVPGIENPKSKIIVDSTLGGNEIFRLE